MFPISSHHLIHDIGPAEISEIGKHKRVSLDYIQKNLFGRNLLIVSVNDRESWNSMIYYQPFGRYISARSGTMHTLVDYCSRLIDNIHSVPTDKYARVLL
jgi:hypothetical protein